MYALLFTAALFALPALLVGGWAWALEKYPFTERGINLMFVALLAIMLTLALVLGVFVPTPYEFGQ